MNKVFVDGWIYDLESKTLEYGVDETRFKLKTKKLVGMKERVKAEYYYIPCYTKGKKATNIKNNITEGARVYFWGRIVLDDGGRLTLAVDEIEFL